MEKISTLLKHVLQEYPEVYMHSINVSRLATMFALYLEMSPQEVQKICLGAYLHDIGKIGIPKEILFKKGKLETEEYKEIQKHPLIGYGMAADLIQDEEIKIIILQHHERCDGKGYPLGLNKDEIHLYARIVSLCDVYDALISDRPYRKAYSKQEALDMMGEGMGTQFDEVLGEKFLKFIQQNAVEITLESKEKIKCLLSEIII